VVQQVTEHHQQFGPGGRGRQRRHVAVDVGDEADSHVGQPIRGPGRAGTAGAPEPGSPCARERASRLRDVPEYTNPGSVAVDDTENLADMVWSNADRF